MDNHQRGISQQQPHVGGETILHNKLNTPRSDSVIYTYSVYIMYCLYVYFRCGRLPSRECAEVFLAILGLAPLLAKAAELASYLPSPLCYTHSLVLAHNISSMYFQSGETQPEESVSPGSLEHHLYI